MVLIEGLWPLLRVPSPDGGSLMLIKGFLTLGDA